MSSVTSSQTCPWRGKPVYDTLDKVAAHGGELVTAPYPEGALSVATFRDPAGNEIGVWQQD
jgi:predicted enzyme related to lactoylglutathione lyase